MTTWLSVTLQRLGRLVLDAALHLVTNFQLLWSLNVRLQVGTSHETSGKRTCWKTVPRVVQRGMVDVVMLRR